MKNYIGITGFKTVGEVGQVAEMFDRHGLPDGYTAMFGILSSHYLLQNPEESWERFPRSKDIPSLVRSAPDWSVPMIHYQTSEKSAMVDDMSHLFSEIYDDCKAVQLNMHWPDVKDVAKIREEFPEMDVLLCLTAGAMRGLTSKQIAERSGEYSGLVSYVLFDPSGGAGMPFDIDQGLDVVRGVRQVLPEALVGYAGGLSGENVYDVVQQIRARDDDFFIDAEGRLMPHGPLDMDCVDAYVREACRAFKD